MNGMRNLSLMAASGRRILMAVALFPLVMLLSGPSPAQGAGYAEPTMLGSSLPTPSGALRDIPGLGGTKPAATQASVTRHAMAFEMMAFNFSYKGEVYPLAHLRKRNSPVAYVFTGDRIGRTVRAVNPLMQMLSLLSGVPARRVLPVKVANFVIYTGPSPKTGSRDYCIGASDIFEQDGVIRRTTIHAGPEVAAFDDCVRGHLIRSFGLSHHQDLLPESLFWLVDPSVPSRLPEVTGLTWSDAVILRTLYDERLKPGMHRDAAMPVARVIIAELLADLNR
ncbi:MAG: hypothetical protein RIC36_14920 [Rhodospirillales bacterium]